MKCTRCGTDLPEDAVFCHICGEKIEKHDDIGDENISKREEPNSEKEKPEDRFDILTILLCMLLPAIVFDLIKYGTQTRLAFLLGSICGTAMLVLLLSLLGRAIVRAITKKKDKMTKYVGIAIGWFFYILYNAIPLIIKLF